jgi:subtilisin
MQHKHLRIFVAAFALAMLYAVMPVPTHASTLTPTQTSALANLLESFGANVAAVEQMANALYASASAAVLGAQTANAPLVGQATAGDVIPGEYIVVLKDATDGVSSLSKVANASKKADKFVAGDNVLKKIIKTRRLYTKALNGFSATLSSQDVTSLKSDPSVAYVVPDRTVTVSQTSAGQTLPTGINRINAENFTNKGAGVQVAVIDTGIDANHPDLAGQVVGGVNCFSTTSPSYADDYGHGTHVAGTIAALDNGFGVVGVAPQAKLWSVKVLGPTGGGSWSNVICGIDFVTAHAPANGGSITVANMSLGGGGSSDNNCGLTNNDPMHAAICRARDAGVTFVVAAGNSGADTSSFSPASYDDAVITVSALQDSDGVPGGFGPATSRGADDMFATFSNYGSAVDVAAPGVDIYSTLPTYANAFGATSYGSLSGTSMAAPHVAGAAALYIAQHPGATWTAVRDALKASGEPAGLGTHQGTDGSHAHAEPVILMAPNVIPTSFLTITRDTSIVVSKVLIGAGETNFTLGNFKFAASGEDIKLDTLGFNFGGGSWPQDLAKVTIWDGTTLVGSVLPTPGTSFTVRLAQSILISNGGSKTLTIKGDAAQTLTLWQASGYVILVNLLGSVTSGTGVTSGTVIKGSGTPFGNLVQIYKTFPIVALKNLPSTTLANGNAQLMRFAISANLSGAVGLGQLKFVLTPTGAVVTQPNLRFYADASYSILLGSATASISASNVVTALFTTPLQVTAGTTVYGELTATISGLSGAASITTKFNNFTGDVGMDLFQDLVNYGDGVPFIWSPNTIGTASYSISDWTADNHLPGLYPSGISQSITGIGTTTGITVTVPNGGEQWEESVLNSVTWTPYNYAPDINPSYQVTAYLEKKDATGNFVTLGKVEESGKASIHWITGQLNSATGPLTMAPSGSGYYIRVVNNVTGASDRSDQPFTLLPVPVDLKINGSDGPVSVQDNQAIQLSWTTTNMSSCNIYNIRQTPGGAATSTLNLPTSGSQTFYAYIAPGQSTQVTLGCYRASVGFYIYDTVVLNPSTNPATLSITQPNGGEKITVGQPYSIQWSATNVSSLSIALYKNDQWQSWIVKDAPICPEKGSVSSALDCVSYQYAYTPTGLETGNPVYKIYITAQKADGSGYVDDKSDAPFQFGSSTPSCVPAVISGETLAPSQASPTQQFGKILTADQSVVWSLPDNPSWATITNAQVKITSPSLVGTYTAALLAVNNCGAKTTGTLTLYVNNGTAAIDQASLITSSSTPIITGTAGGTGAITLSLDQGSGKIYSSGIIGNNGGVWSHQITTPLQSGTYNVTIGNFFSGALLTTGTLKVSLVTPPPAPASWDFGGMYGSGVIDRVAKNYNNPATGNVSCPSGYTAIKAVGTANIDHAFFACYRPHVTGRASLYDFGGMYGTSVNGALSVNYANPVTGAMSCPAGYTTHQILGAPGVDGPVHYCYRAHSTVAPLVGFGGVYGKGANSVLYNNPITGGQSCPAGYTGKVVHSLSGEDYPAVFCYKNPVTQGEVLGASTTGLTEAQIQAIVNLLIAFKVDPVTIGDVEATLRGVDPNESSLGQ